MSAWRFQESKAIKRKRLLLIVTNETDDSDKKYFNTHWKVTAFRDIIYKSKKTKGKKKKVINLIDCDKRTVECFQLNGERK